LSARKVSGGRSQADGEGAAGRRDLAPPHQNLTTWLANGPDDTSRVFAIPG
jgi:hypothetical protein